MSSRDRETPTREATIPVENKALLSITLHGRFWLRKIMGEICSFTQNWREIMTFQWDIWAKSFEKLTFKISCPIWAKFSDIFAKRKKKREQISLESDPCIGMIDPRVGIYCPNEHQWWILFLTYPILLHVFLAFYIWFWWHIYTIVMPDVTSDTMKISCFKTTKMESWCFPNLQSLLSINLWWY